MRHTKNPLGTAYSDLLGRRLRQVRQLKDITLDEAEKLSGVTNKTIQRYERGGLDVSANALQALATAYGVDVKDLCGHAIGYADMIHRIVVLELEPHAPLPKPGEARDGGPL